VSEYDIVKEQGLKGMVDCFEYKKEVGSTRDYLYFINIGDSVPLDRIIDKKIKQIEENLEELKKIISIVNIY
jgi:hypothetical protein